VVNVLAQGDVIAPAILWGMEEIVGGLIACGLSEPRGGRQRIFTASQAGDLARVRNLQELMLRSRSNALVSVRRVTERNAGRLTAGVDSEVVLSPEAKMRLAERMQHSTEPFTALPGRLAWLDQELAGHY
jgi:N-terminal domain of reverse transcriptase